jgi:predicted GNAT family acetyltransferase
MTRPASLGRLERTTRDGLAVTVVDVPDASRFEARVDDTVAAYAQYTLDGDHVVFVHTVTEPDWGGRGIGSALAAGALERHPDAADLVDHRHQRLIRPFTPSEETP